MAEIDDAQPSVAEARRGLRMLATRMDRRGSLSGGLSAVRRETRSVTRYSFARGSPYQFVPGSPRMRAAPSRIEVTIDW